MTRSHLTLSAVVVVWAGSFSAIKTLLDHGLAAGDIAILRYAIAAPGFAFILVRARGLPGLTRRDGVRVVLAGLAVVVGYHVSLNLGERWTTSGVAALVVALSPAMTLVLAVVLGLERLRPGRVLGLVVAFVGVGVAVSLGTGKSLSLENLKGPFVVLGAPLAFALYNVVLKPLLERYDLLALTAATSLVGLLGLAALTSSSTVHAAANLSAGDGGLILYLGVLATLLGYIGWNVGLRGLGATRAVSFTYAISPLALVIGAIALGETLTPWLVVGAALVVAGIALTQRGARRSEPRAGETEPPSKGLRPEASAAPRSVS